MKRCYFCPICGTGSDKKFDETLGTLVKKACAKIAKDELLQLDLDETRDKPVLIFWPNVALLVAEAILRMPLSETMRVGTGDLTTPGGEGKMGT